MRKGENTKFTLDRKLFSSRIWFASPWKLKIWIYLIGNANHKNGEFMGEKIKRGQLLRSYRTVSEDCAYYVGYRKKKPSLSTVRRICEELTKELRTTLRATPQGMLITILNYNPLQPMPKTRTEHVTDCERRGSSQVPVHNNNDKNDKNVKKRALPHFKEWLDYRKEIKKPITVKATLVSLVKRFNSEPIERIKWVVNHSIENNYMGLFWEKYKEETPPKPKKRINHYDYKCLNCNKLFHKREIKGDDDFDAYRCDENGCQTVGLGKDGKNMVGVQLKFIKAVYKE